MALTEEQQLAERTLTTAYPAGVGFDIKATTAAIIRVYDELVKLGRAELLTEEDDPDFAGKRAYRLSDTAAEDYRRRADEADLN